MKPNKFVLTAAGIAASAFFAHAQWGLSGNSISSGNFLGTTNDEDLLLKRNSNHIFSALANDVYLLGPLPAATQSGLFSFAIGNFKSLHPFTGSIGNDNSNYSFVIGNISLNAGSSYSFGMGNNVATVESDHCFVLGNDILFGNDASNTSCFAIGNNIILNEHDAAAVNRFVIGSGLSAANLSSFTNNSLSVGFNSDIATLFVGPSAGASTTGNVGIGTSSPSEKLDVTGNINIAGATGRRLYMGAASSTFGIGFSSSFPDYGIFYTEGSTDYVSLSPNGSATNGVMNIMGDGNVGIGTNAPGYKLHLKDGDFVITNSSTNVFKVSSTGYVTARQVDVNLDVIPDYVFAKDYKLMSLEELEQYVQSNRHLPRIKSAAEYDEAGSINLGELNLKLLEKVEELSLYVIELNKKVQALEDAACASQK